MRTWIYNISCIVKTGRQPPVREGGQVCLFANNSCCVISNVKEVSSFCLPVLEYLIISNNILFTKRFFLAVYLPPQTDAGTKTTLNELHKAISTQGNAHPEEALLVASDLMQEN